MVEVALNLCNVSVVLHCKKERHLDDAERNHARVYATIVAEKDRDNDRVSSVAVEGNNNKANLTEEVLTSWTSVVEDGHECRVDNDLDWISQPDKSVPKNFEGEKNVQVLNYAGQLDWEHLDIGGVDTDPVAQKVVNTHLHAEQMPHALQSPCADVP